VRAEPNRSDIPRTAIVTGAGRNIGRAIALELAQAGYRVLLVGRTLEPLEFVRYEIELSGGMAVAASCDVTRPEQVREAVGRAEEALGPIQVLVNNAVNRLHGPFLEMTPAQWHATLEVTCGGAIYCAQAVLCGMLSRGAGRIINIAGVTGQIGASERAAVAAAKSGLIGLTKALALEFADRGITVNAVSPGQIDTDRAASNVDDPHSIAAYSAEASRIPARRLGTPAEVARLCRYLASDDAAYITGQVIGINGGLAT